MSLPVWVVACQRGQVVRPDQHDWDVVLGIFPISRRSEAELLMAAVPGARLHPGSVDSGVSFNYEVSVVPQSTLDGVDVSALP